MFVAKAIKRMARGLLVVMWAVILVTPVPLPVMFGARAKLSLYVVSRNGEPTFFRVDSFRDAKDPDVELAGLFRGMTFDKAVLGHRYVCRLSPMPQSRGYPPMKRTIWVRNENAVVPLLAESGMLPTLDRPVGRTCFVIRPSPVKLIDEKLTWVKVQPAFAVGEFLLLPEPEATVVNRDGTFFLNGHHGGVYVVSIYRGSTILKLLSIEIPLLPPSEPIEIRLDDGVQSWR